MQSPFASKDDVVHAINNAIDVLEGKSSQFTQSQALRILVHLVGDIHQPLHTVSGYYDVTDPQHPKLITDANAALGNPNDRGGNQLYHTKTLELHAWAKQWAGDSAKVANSIYKNITFGPATLAADRTIQRIEITISDKYSSAETTLAQTQLAKGAVHLAQLLNSIRYK